MTRLKKAISIKTIQRISGIFLAVSVLIFIAVGFSVQYQDLHETYLLAEKAAGFLKSECQKYENYVRGNTARSMQDLLDKAIGLKKFISSSELTDSEFLHDFIRSEHVGGVMVLDSEFQPLAQSDMDHHDSFELWSDFLSREDIRDTMKHPQKTYIDHVTLNHVSYDVAVVASDEGDQLIVCYSSTKKPSTDPYELTVQSILTDNSFYKNPTLVITDGTQVLSTNDPIVEELGTAQYRQLSETIDWKEGQLTEFSYQGTTFYGLRRVYGQYFVYAVYASKEVFSNRTDYIAFCFMAYLAVCVVILAVQRHLDKLSMRKMEKQLRIINAISTSYSSTFLLHIDSMELEPIHPSERLKEVFEKHRNAYDFLFAVCKSEVAPEYHPEVMHFLDLDTIAERLKGKPFLGSEVKDSRGGWYSILLIPQKYDDAGNIQALLVTTRDVTSMKQAEELSFKDRLTGLRNRNYMESRSKNFARSGDYPVSLIMADCNYLKRTNDTLGHEYGDLLLQRVANVIQESISAHDVAMRIGGDEFLILCTKCDEEKARQMIETLKRKLKERSDEKLTLSVAFGASTTREGERSFEQAYELADQAMYLDKKAAKIQR